MPQAPADRPNVAEVWRFVRGESRHARERLAERWPVPDAAIHEARKSLKKARAGLRLARTALGERAYRRQNRAFRDAARPLSAVRDARVLVETLDALIARASPAERRRLAPVRTLLVADQRRRRARMLRDRGALAAVLDPLRQGRQRARRWPSGGWSRLRPGLVRVYRAGRKAFGEARERPTDERLHEWRKQVKYLWHHLQVLEPSRPRVLGRMAREAHRLSDLLGEDHDLAVLLDRLQRAGRRIGSAALETVSNLVVRRRERLQARARRGGGEVYRLKPEAFVARIEGPRAGRASDRARPGARSSARRRPSAARNTRRSPARR